METAIRVMNTHPPFKGRSIRILLTKDLHYCLGFIVIEFGVQIYLEIQLSVCGWIRKVPWGSSRFIVPLK